MKVIWAPEARQDRVRIRNHIAAESPAAAVRMDQLFSDAAKTLSEFPMRGRLGKVPGTRELLPHDSYRLVYQVDGDVVRVLALIHTARQWPRLD